MASVISLKDHKRKQEIESEFAQLLAKEVEVEGNVVPLSNSLLERMFALKAAGDKARGEENSGLLQG